jgi:hypothetical protein
VLSQNSERRASGYFLQLAQSSRILDLLLVAGGWA